MIKHLVCHHLVTLQEARPINHIFLTNNYIKINKGV